MSLYTQVKKIQNQISIIFRVRRKFDCTFDLLSSKMSPPKAYNLQPHTKSGRLFYASAVKKQHELHMLCNTMYTVYNVVFRERPG